MDGAQTRVRRLPERQVEDVAFLHSVLDEGIVCHVAFVEGGLPYVVPTGYVRDGDRLLLHGSRASRLLRHLAAGHPVAIAVTHLDGLVLARSAFHHSMNYRSAMLFGTATPLPPAETAASLATYMERLVPGQHAAARPPSAKELAATIVVAFPIATWSCKSRKGPPGDEPEDLAWPSWAGVVPLRLATAAPQQDPTQATRPAPTWVESWRPAARGADHRDS